MCAVAAAAASAAVGLLLVNSLQVLADAAEGLFWHLPGEPCGVCA